MKKLWLVFLLVIVAMIMSLVPMMGAASSNGNQDPGSIDKIIFVHYPKKEATKPSPGGIKLTNQLSPTYKYSGIRWATDNIEYYVNPTGSGVDNTNTLAAIDASFETWDLASVPLTFNYAGTTEDNAGVYDGQNIVSWGNVDYTNAIAVTYIWYYRDSKIIYECDTIMNVKLPWSYNNVGDPTTLADPASPINSYADPSGSGVAGSYDIRNIMTHEAGHWILLGDLYNSRDSYLTMYGYGSTGEIRKDTLGYGDELGVEKAYGI